MNYIKLPVIIVCLSFIIMGMIFIPTSYAEIDPATIVAGWLFDGDTKDFSGNGKDGDIVGDPKWVEGKFGDAIELNGTSDWVTVPEIGTFEEVTIAEWAKCTGRLGAWRVIYNADGWKMGDVHHQLYSNNVIGFSLHSNPGGNDKKSNFMFDDSQLDVWHHVATVYSAKEGWVRFFVDGELDAEREWGNLSAVLGPGRIGSWDGGGREWQGMFDEFTIFNVALEENDIQELMNGVGFSVELAAKVATIWGKIKSN
jgi:hypothetical protein